MAKCQLYLGDECKMIHLLIIQFTAFIAVANAGGIVLDPNEGNLSKSYPDYKKYDEEFLYAKFPKGFSWGASTSAYQIEGGWNVDGKGLSIWDEFVRRIPSPIADNSTGDIACDSYRKSAIDVQLLKRIGANHYRFSISWPRILPNGTPSYINQAGIDYYNNLINDLLRNGIQPYVTLYHWDLPLKLQKKGGWLSDKMIKYFEDYARVAFQQFGDRVKTWFTFNEPNNQCVFTYEAGNFAPGIFRNPAVDPYTCAHVLLKSHARVYRLYQKEFKRKQNGRIGMVIHSSGHEPASDNKEDIEATERALLFDFGWFGHPIVFGNYPEVMITLIGNKSKAEGLLESRLPVFNEHWQSALKGSWDFIGYNHYTTVLVKNQVNDTPGWTSDQNTFMYQDPTWESSSSSWLKVVPWGFRKALNWIRTTYNNPAVIVAENGVSGNSTEGVYDPQRIRYYTQYINQMLKAVLKDNCNVKAYTVWSLLDNFEWASGYTQRFGIYHVDFTKPDRPRTPKASARFLNNVFRNNGFN